MQKDERICRYEAAAQFLPTRLRRLAGELPTAQKAEAEEFRLRTGWPMTVLLPTGEVSLNGDAVEALELETLCDLATEFSRYAAIETMRDGYLPVRGGFRVGLAGTAVIKDGFNSNLRDLSSAVIRIAREKRGISAEVAPQLFENGHFASTLILSAPGGGKTTLLRDLVRCLSEGGDAFDPCRVSLIDERGEVAVMHQGRPQMNVGPHTDVLDGCPKAVGIPMMLRVMNPQIIAVDEITQQADLQAITMAAGCGVELLATIHAANLSELERKPLYAELLKSGIFRFAVCIQRTETGRAYQVEALPC